jgi:hypothetical protein
MTDIISEAKSPVDDDNGFDSNPDSGVTTRVALT